MGGGGGNDGGDDRQQDEDKKRAEEIERAQREAEERDRERREREREQRQQESDDADKRRAEEQARAQREAEERDRERREREAAAAEAQRRAAAEAERQKQADEDKRRAQEIERAQRETDEREAVARMSRNRAAREAEADRQKELDEIAKRNAAENADLMPKGDPYTDPQKASGVRTDAKSLRNYEERKNEALRQNSEANIVQSNQGEVTDTQGNPVLTRQGVEQKTAFEQQELERLVSMRQGGKGDPEEGKRDLAKQIIEEKLAADPTLPPALKAIREINLRNQLKNLEAGGTPTFRIGEGGEFVTSGVLQPGEEGTGIAPNITSDLETMMDEREQEEEPTILQAEPEPEPEVAATGTLGVAAAPRGRRGTRSKRAGAGGTLLEGGGVLYE